MWEQEAGDSGYVIYTYTATLGTECVCVCVGGGGGGVTYTQYGNYLLYVIVSLKPPRH